MLQDLIRIAHQYPKTRIHLVPIFQKQAADDEAFAEFLDQVHEGGKEKIRNPDPNNLEKYPEIEVSSARKYQPYEERLQREYQAWSKKKPKSKSGEPSLEALKKALTEVKSWPEAKKAEKFWELPTSKEPPMPLGSDGKPLDRVRLVPDGSRNRRQAGGAVTFNEKGQILIREPSNHYDGYVWTFPKGKRDRDAEGAFKETLATTARREMREETGWSADLVSLIPKPFERGNSDTFLYLAKAKAQEGETDDETQGLKWVSLDEASKWIKQTTNPKGQIRDLSVIEAAREHRDKLLAEQHAKTSASQKPAPAPAKETTPAKKETIPAKKETAPAKKETIPAKEPTPPKKETPPSKKLNLKDIMHKKIAEATGGNPGGVYEGSDGKKRYVKLYHDPAQAWGEHLANHIYSELGIGAPESSVIEDKDGHPVYTSDWVNDIKAFRYIDTKGGGEGISKELAKNAIKGFAADVLLGNRDVSGGKNSNFMRNNATGDVIRLDNGASFLVRAQGERKDSDQLNNINEWDGFSTRNKNYRRVMEIAGYGHADEMSEYTTPLINKIEKLSKRPGGWKKLVGDQAPGLKKSDKDKITEMLETRTKLLIEKRDQAKAKTARLIAFRWFLKK